MIDPLDLHDLAYFLSTRPALAAAMNETTFYIVAHDAEEFRCLVSELGACTKKPAGEMMGVERQFGNLTIRIIIGREQVCTRRVVGQRTIPASPERTEDIVEWDCEPIFGGGHSEP